MKKWQQENKEQRGVLCIVTDKDCSINTLFGKSLPLMAALLSVMIKDSAFVSICEGALVAKKNPIAAIELLSAFEKSKDEEMSIKNDKNDSSDTSINKALKTILTKLADKLCQ